jgi:SAM-dependent methyltransferase
MRLHTEYAAFPTRDERSRYVAQRFRPYLTETVLDVGCFEAPLRSLLPDVQYTGLDMAGAPDIWANLEQLERLPFENGVFHCVVCVHVLEHLNNLHEIFDELVRVSNRYLVIGLPNCWRGARRPIARGIGGFRHYGLAKDPPADRHKWFFNISDAQAFLVDQTTRTGLVINELFVTDSPRSAPIRWFRRIRYPGIRYANRYSNTLWVVYEKS